MPQIDPDTERQTAGPWMLPRDSWEFHRSIWRVLGLDARPWRIFLHRRANSGGRAGASDIESARRAVPGQHARCGAACRAGSRGGREKRAPVGSFTLGAARSDGRAGRGGVRVAPARCETRQGAAVAEAARRGRSSARTARAAPPDDPKHPHPRPADWHGSRNSRGKIGAAAGAPALRASCKAIGDGRPDVALSNAEKQARWRARQRAARQSGDGAEAEPAVNVGRRLEAMAAELVELRARIDRLQERAAPVANKAPPPRCARPARRSARQK